ncbi:MAG: hypothetical protein HOC23_21540 [Halieaceae bacterium]|jgi:hypothetical protein|nr:hypothetical protein [Halieaceae bacterium]
MNTSNSRSREVARQVGVIHGRIRACYPMDRAKLAALNLAVFKSLCQSGVSRGRICNALCLNTAEYRYAKNRMGC